MTDEPIEPEKPKGLSTFSKVALGCAAAVAAFLLVAFGLMAFGLWWAMSPGKQYDTRRLASAETVMVVHTGDVLEDEGVRALLDALWAAFQEMGRLQRNQEGMPEALEWLDDFNASMQPSGSDSVAVYVPSEATLTFEPASDGEGLALLVAINFQNFVRPIRFAVEEFAADGEGAITHDVAGCTMFEVETDFYIGFAAGTLLMGTDLAVLEAAIGRMDVEDDAPHADAAVRVEEDRQRWVVAGAGGPGNLRDLLETVLDEELEDVEDFSGWVSEVPERFTALRAGIQPVGADRIDAWAEIESDDPEGMAASFRGAFSDLEEEWEFEHIDLETWVDVHGKRVEARLTISGIERGLEAWLDEFR